MAAEPPPPHLVLDLGQPALGPVSLALSDGERERCRAGRVQRAPDDGPRHLGLGVGPGQLRLQRGQVARVVVIAGLQVRERARVGGEGRGRVLETGVQAVQPRGHRTDRMPEGVGRPAVPDDVVLCAAQTGGRMGGQFGRPARERGQTTDPLGIREQQLLGARVRGVGGHRARVSDRGTGRASGRGYRPGNTPVAAVRTGADPGRRAGGGWSAAQQTGPRRAVVAHQQLDVLGRAARCRDRDEQPVSGVEVAARDPAQQPAHAGGPRRGGLQPRAAASTTADPDGRAPVSPRELIERSRVVRPRQLQLITNWAWTECRPRGIGVRCGL